MFIEVILAIVAISQFIRAVAYKRALKAIGLYLKDIDAVPDKETVDKYSREALRRTQINVNEKRAERRW